RGPHLAVADLVPALVRSGRPRPRDASLVDLALAERGHRSAQDRPARGAALGGVAPPAAVGPPGVPGAATVVLLGSEAGSRRRRRVDLVRPRARARGGSERRAPRRRAPRRATPTAHPGPRLRRPLCERLRARRRGQGPHLAAARRGARGRPGELPAAGAGAEPHVLVGARGRTPEPRPGALDRRVPAPAPHAGASRGAPDGAAAPLRAGPVPRHTAAPGPCGGERLAGGGSAGGWSRRGIVGLHPAGLGGGERRRRGEPRLGAAALVRGPPPPHAG